MSRETARGLFVTATGTGIGKTWLTRGLASALRAHGAPVIALKPIETGCDPEPLDAVALAEACGRPELADAPGLHRGRLPLSPWAATLRGDAPYDHPRVVSSTRALLAEHAGVHLVEGAGGVLVPLDEEHDILDLVRDLALPLVLAAADALGTLSHTLTAVESCARRGITPRAVVMTGNRVEDDAGSNRALLARRLDVPVLAFTPRDESDLARAAEPLLAPLGLTRRRPAP
ncbi:MAG: dethiobiotin synthase [Myxococcota bacterium]|nr:dethiobiotin synthase [Myxococcota bacterium]